MGAFLSFVRHIYGFYGVGNMHASSTSQALAATSTGTMSMPTSLQNSLAPANYTSCGYDCFHEYMSCVMPAGINNNAIQSCFNNMTACYWDTCKISPPSLEGPFDTCMEQSRGDLLECFKGDQKATIDTHPGCKDDWITNISGCLRMRPELLSTEERERLHVRDHLEGFLMLFCDDQIGWDCRHGRYLLDECQNLHVNGTEQFPTIRIANWYSAYKVTCDLWSEQDCNGQVMECKEKICNISEMKTGVQSAQCTWDKSKDPF